MLLKILGILLLTPMVVTILTLGFFMMGGNKVVGGEDDGGLDSPMMRSFILATIVWFMIMGLLFIFAL